VGILSKRFGNEVNEVRTNVSGISGRRPGDFLLFGVTAAELALLLNLTPTFTAVDWIYVLQHLLVLLIASRGARLRHRISHCRPASQSW